MPPFYATLLGNPTFIALDAPPTSDSLADPNYPVLAPMSTAATTAPSTDTQTAVAESAAASAAATTTEQPVASPSTTVEPTQSPSPPASSAAEPTTQSPSPQPSTAEPTQEPSSAPPPQSSAPPPASSSPPPQSSAQPTTPPPSTSPSAQPTTQPSSAAPSSEAQPTTSSASPSSSQQQQQQQQQQQSSAAAPTTSAAVTSQAAQSSSAPSLASDITSAVEVTTTDGNGKVATVRPEQLTTTAISTDGNGKVWTVTQVIHNPTGVNDAGSSQPGNNDFMENTGAVAGTFVVVGLAITAGVLAFVFFMLRRRRRQRLDRDVAAAAAAAAAGAHHSRSGFDDDEDEKTANAASTQYGGYYAATDYHNQPQPNMGAYDYEDPAGGYDHYASTIPTPGDRSSTATAPGLAGFGAQSAQATYGQHNDMYTHQEGYEEVMDPLQQQYQQGGYNAMSRESVPGQSGYYFDPKDAGQYDYADEDVYAYNDQPRPTHHRSGSEGSVARGADAGPGLKITNA